MNTSLIFFFGFILSLSICLNAYLFLQKKKKPKREQSLELQEFLGDLLSGVGIVAITRVDPSSILLRSPKTK